MNNSKKFLITFYISLSFAFLSPELYSQAIDEDFLNSLPSSIKDEVISSSSDKTATQKDDKNFAVVSTDVQKINETLETLKQGIADIESKVEYENLQGASLKGLSRFGDKFFKTFQSTFLPVNKPNVSSNYLIDISDSLEVMLVGQKDETYELSVARDGSISIPEIGKIYVAGLSLGKATEVIEAKINQTFIGVTAFTTILSIRDINILVIGNVNRPGMYTLGGNSSIINVIDASGGISKSGSYRNIVIKRDNEIIDSIDLYRTFIYGDLKFNHSLRTGDVIIVNSAKSEVAISGGISNPSIYEINESESILDVIKNAGGMNQYSNSSVPVKIISYQGSQVSEKLYSLSELGDLKPKNRDEIFVSYFEPGFQKARKVEVTGEVKNPGVYIFSKGDRLSDVIKNAGGYTKYAYPEGGILLNNAAKEIEARINDRLYQETIEYIAASSGGISSTLNSTNNLEIILQEFKQVLPVGRVNTEFNLYKLESDPMLDVFMEDGDQIFIPQFKNSVHILGEVLQPGTSQYVSGNSAHDYIKSAGGLAKFSDKKRVILIQPNGDAYLINSKLLNLSVIGLGDRNLFVTPGSVIYVPRDIGKLEGLDLATSIAPILSSLAISLASLNSISD